MLITSTGHRRVLSSDSLSREAGENRRGDGSGVLHAVLHATLCIEVGMQDFNNA